MPELDILHAVDHISDAVAALYDFLAAETNPDRKRQAAAVLTALKAAQASLRELWISYDDVPY